MKIRCFESRVVYQVRVGCDTSHFSRVSARKGGLQGDRGGRGSGHSVPAEGRPPRAGGKSAARGVDGKLPVQLRAPPPPLRARPEVSERQRKQPPVQLSATNQFPVQPRTPPPPPSGQARPKVSGERRAKRFLVQLHTPPPPPSGQARSRRLEAYRALAARGVAAGAPPVPL